LVGKGVEANRVYTEGKGERQPVTGKTCSDKMGRKALIDCLQPDRRVEVELIGTK
jgi:OOP family OmpA-OmpF porin